MKRFRQKTANDNELKLYYGNNDAYTVWGNGVSSTDSNLLLSVMCCPRNRYLNSEQLPSLIDELKSSGYDLNTLSFSIKKTVTNS